MKIDNKFCVSRTKSGVFALKWYGNEIPPDDCLNIAGWIMVMLEQWGLSLLDLESVVKSIKDGIKRDSLFHPLLNFESRYPPSAEERP